MLRVPGHWKKRFPEHLELETIPGSDLNILGGLRAAAIGGGVSRDRGGVPMCSLTGVKPLSESVITIVKHRDAKSDLLRQLSDLRWLPLPSSQWVRLQCQSAAIRAVRRSGHRWR